MIQRVSIHHGSDVADDVAAGQKTRTPAKCSPRLVARYQIDYFARCETVAHKTMNNIKSNKKALSPKQREELLGALKARFEKNKNRHEGLEWARAFQEIA